MLSFIQIKHSFSFLIQKSILVKRSAIEPSINILKILSHSHLAKIKAAGLGADTEYGKRITSSAVIISVQLPHFYLQSFLRTRALYPSICMRVSLIPWVYFHYDYYIVPALYENSCPRGCTSMPSTQGALRLGLTAWLREFSPDPGSGRAFWVLPVCVGMRCQSAPFLVQEYTDTTQPLGPGGAGADASRSHFCTIRTPQFWKQ